MTGPPVRGRAGSPVRGRPGLPFTRRQRLLLVAAVAVLVLAAVLLDLVQHATPAEQAGDLRSYYSEVSGDVSACNANLADGLAAYRQVRAGTSHDLRDAVRIAQDAEPLCTPAENPDLYDLATIDPPASLARYDVSTAAEDLYEWAFPNAAGVLVDIAQLLQNHAPASSAADLRSRCAALTSLAAAAEKRLGQAANGLGVRLTALSLASCSAAGS